MSPFAFFLHHEARHFFRRRYAAGVLLAPNPVSVLRDELVNCVADEGRKNDEAVEEIEGEA